MPGGCWICNPMCGRCKPPAYKSVKCPECGALNIIQKADVIERTGLACKRCAHDLTEEVVPKPIRCKFSGLVCAYPCGKSVSGKEEYGNNKCEFNTPPRR